jgi:hypothetical protein
MNPHMLQYRLHCRPPCCKHSFPEIHEVACNKRTLTERHVITFRKQLISLINQHVWAILVKLGEINKILSILSTSI